jgi:molybdopterin-containing oxidoreductase family iron-sulfur binding subunit
MTLLAAGGDENTTGEKVKVLTTDGKLVEVDSGAIKEGHSCGMNEISREESRKGIPGRKFVMVIDLGRCRNARKCVSACQKMHYLPTDKEWLTVNLMQDSDNSAPYWMPKTCFHCDKPPCTKVCPVGATFKRDDGIVLIDNEMCIGCKFCMTACPYSTRVFNWDEPTDIPEDVMNRPYNVETGAPQVVGTVGKCDFCPDMLRENKLPDCVTACPNGVFYFGDLNEDTVTNGDETVRFSELIRDKAGYRFAEDLGTEPSVYYLPPVNRIFPFESGFKDLPESQSSRYHNIPFINMR